MVHIFIFLWTIAIHVGTVRSGNGRGSNLWRMHRSARSSTTHVMLPRCGPSYSKASLSRRPCKYLAAALASPQFPSNACNARACLRISSSRNMGRPFRGKLCASVATQDAVDTSGIGRLSAGRPSTSRTPFSFEPRMLENDQCLHMGSVWIRLAASKANYQRRRVLFRPSPLF